MKKAKPVILMDSFRDIREAKKTKCNREPPRASEKKVPVGAQQGARKQQEGHKAFEICHKKGCGLKICQ